MTRLFRLSSGGTGITWSFHLASVSNWYEDGCIYTTHFRDRQFTLYRSSDSAGSWRWNVIGISLHLNIIAKPPSSLSYKKPCCNTVSVYTVHSKALTDYWCFGCEIQITTKDSDVCHFNFMYHCKLCVHTFRAGWYSKNVIMMRLFILGSILSQCMWNHCFFLS